VILGHRHLAHVLRIYVRHYNEHRPHRALQLLPPNGGDPTPLTALALAESFEGMGFSLLGEADWRWQGEYLEYQSETIHWGYSLCCMTLRKLA
jgi:hypothetical protein